MKLKTDMNNLPIQVIGFNPNKTLNITIDKGGSYTLDVSDDIYVKIVKTDRPLTTEMNGDGNVVDLQEYYIGENFKTLKINNTDTNNAANVIVFRA